MAQVCDECGGHNADGDRFCRGCGEPLSGSVESATNLAFDRRRTGTGPWLATILIGVLLLCCLGLVGVASLDELVPAHPLRTLLVGTPTPTATHPATPTLAPTESPSPPPALTSTPQAGMDSFEPDDTTAQARDISTDGTSQTHTLSPPRDRDYVFFQAGARMHYTVETGNLGDDCDTILTLYDEDGTQLIQDDDGADESLASRLTWVADEEGLLFVEVTHFEEEAGGEDAEYDIWVLESEPLATEEDEYEPDDTMGQANEILLDTPQTHNIHAPGDHDWILFGATEGATYVIETFQLGGEMDTIIYLYDEDGEELAQNDDGGEESLASRITWGVDSTGILYVMIQNYWDDGAGPDMQYSVSVSEGAPYEADAHEPDDSMDQASEIEIGSRQSHNLHVTGDHDWISFQVVAGTDYVIETSNLGDRIDTIISLYDADGHEVSSDDDGGDEPLASRLTWTPEEDGVVNILVRDLGDDESGPGTEYGVSVREEATALLSADEYEPDDTMAEAGEIGMGEVQTHDIHTVGDHDWLYFEAAQGVTYLIETSNLGQEVDTVVFLYDEDGEELAQDDDGADEPRASRITWAAEQTGTLHIMVHDYKDNRAGPAMEYDLSVDELEPVRGETRVYIAEGSYHIVAHEVGNFTIGVSGRLSLDNFSLEVDAAQVSGDDDNEYGLAYGYQDRDNYYEIAISGDGYAGSYVKERGDWHTIVAFRPSEAINRGNAVNHLHLEVLEGTFSLYVNGQLAFQDYDNRFREGLIGFGCGSLAEPGLHCSFDNLNVWNEEGSLVWQDDFDDGSGNWFESP